MKTLLIPLLALALLPALAENYYDHNGADQGRTETDSSGNKRFYDRNGTYQGRTHDVRYYDRNGAYRGRQENGRFYDQNGAYRGRKQ